MPKARTSSFDSLRERGWRVVEKWAAALPRGVSIPLHEFALAHGVRRIQFEPLFSSAGLSKVADGYVIHINTEAHGVHQAEGTILEVNEVNLRELGPAARFSVAHEIAHAVFIQIAGSGKTSSLHRHTKLLERACNEMAGVMLLPKAHLLASVSEEFFDAGRVLQVMKSFGVSADTLILRLKSEDFQGALSGLDGILAVAVEKNGPIHVDRCHVAGPYASRIWKNLVEIQDSPPWERLHVESEHLASIRNALKVNEAIHMRIDQNRSLKCLLTSERLRTSPLRLVIGIRVVGHLEKTPLLGLAGQDNRHG